MNRALKWYTVPAVGTALWTALVAAAKAVRGLGPVGPRSAARTAEELPPAPAARACLASARPSPAKLCPAVPCKQEAAPMFTLNCPALPSAVDAVSP